MYKKTGLVFFPAFDWAISPTHPEREERLLYTRDQLFEEGIMDLPQIVEYKPRHAQPKDIARTHFCLPSIEEKVHEAHLVAAGSALVLADALMKKEIKKGFALVRPPGHHAMKVVHGNRGFCNINNEAIMVDYLRRHYGVKRIAIIDTDVHHGDGTQDIFYHDPDLLFISFHQDGRTLYPGTGFIEELGGPRAYGKTINIPLPPGTGDEGILYVLNQLILPILQDFKPEIVINSAGQDNHYSDPLANMKVTAQGYAKLTEKLNPDLAVLEGGYAVETALPYVNLAITLSLAGLDYSNVKEPDLTFYKQSKDISETIKKTTEKIQKIWLTRDAIDTESFYGKNFYERRKSIFYDTEYIHEDQLERLKKCKDCAGFLTIDTIADTPRGVQKALCISIPIDACPKCHQEASELFELKQKDGKDGKDRKDAILQDKKKDIYKHFNAKLSTVSDIT